MNRYDINDNAYIDIVSLALDSDDTAKKVADDLLADKEFRKNFARANNVSQGEIRFLIRFCSPAYKKRMEDRTGKEYRPDPAKLYEYCMQEHLDLINQKTGVDQEHCLKLINKKRQKASQSKKYNGKRPMKLDKNSKKKKFKPKARIAKSLLALSATAGLVLGIHSHMNQGPTVEETNLNPNIVSSTTNRYMELKNNQKIDDFVLARGINQDSKDDYLRYQSLAASVPLVADSLSKDIDEDVSAYSLYNSEALDQLTDDAITSKLVNDYDLPDDYYHVSVNQLDSNPLVTNADNTKVVVPQRLASDKRQNIQAATNVDKENVLPMDDELESIVKTKLSLKNLRTIIADYENGNYGNLNDKKLETLQTAKSEANKKSLELIDEIASLYERQVDEGKLEPSEYTYKNLSEKERNDSLHKSKSVPIEYLSRPLDNDEIDNDEIDFE